MKFTSTNFDVSVFVFNDKKIYIVVYVNDLLIMKFDLNFINSLKRKLTNRFKIIDLNFVQHYLSVEIVREKNSILFRQTTYLTKILKRFRMQNCFVLNSFIKLNFDKILKITKKINKLTSKLFININRLLIVLCLRSQKLDLIYYMRFYY